MAEPIDMPFGCMTRVAEPYFRWGPDPPSEGAVLSRERAAHCKV